MIDMLLLLVAALLFWYSAFILISVLIKKSRRSVSPSERFLLSAMSFALIIFVVTEGLSLFSSLTQDAVRVTWASLFLLSVIANVVLIRKDKKIFNELLREFKVGRQSLVDSSRFIKAILVMLLISALLLLVVIFNFPTPNNGDSMRYHLARTIYWKQQANVSYYATHNLRQITFPPLAEYALFNSIMLLGNDNLTRAVQWASMLVVFVGVAEITKKLGGSTRQQTVTALLAASIPMGIMQATSTQNDYILSAWLVCLVVFGLALLEDISNPIWPAAAGVALGLAVLTKGTAYVIALPFCLWLAYRMLRSQNLSIRAWRAGFVIVLIALAINLGQLGRNYIILGAPLGENHEEINESFGDKIFASVLIRNIQVHMLPEVEAFPKLYNDISKFMTSTLNNLHSLTTIDIKDPKFTYVGSYRGFDNPMGLSLNEGVAGNFIHMLLMLIAIPIGFFFANNFKTKQLLAVAVFTFALFSFLLKTNTFISRLQLPLFILWVPILALVLFKDKRKFSALFPVLIWLAAVPWLSNNAGLPLLPQVPDYIVNQLALDNNLYFLSYPESIATIDLITDRIVKEDCLRIGLAFHIFEYPFWMKLEQKGYKGTIQHVYVENESRVLEDSDPLPCMILAGGYLEALKDYEAVQFDRNILFIAPN